MARRLKKILNHLSRETKLSNFEFDDARNVNTVTTNNTSGNSNDYEKIAFKMYLNEGQKAEYKKRHDLIPSEWPELAQELRDAGIFDYSIFLDDETNILFAVLKRKKNHTMDQLAEKEIMKKWWKYMASLMKTIPDSPFGQPVATDLSMVFHMD